MEKKTLRRFDLVFSILLIVGSIFYLFESVTLFLNPFGKAWSTVTSEGIANLLEKWYESPGLLPFIVGALLLICAIALLLRAIKDGARFDFFKKEKIVALKKNKELITVCLVVFMLAVYIYALIPICREFLNFFKGFQGFPFAIATSVYIVANTIVFSKKTKKDIIMAFVVGIIASFVIVLLFNKVALIPMP